MKSDKAQNKSVSQLFAEITPIEEAVKAGAREALLRHKLLRQPAAVWRDGKVVWVSPDELEDTE